MYVCCLHRDFAEVYWTLARMQQQQGKSKIIKSSPNWPAKGFRKGLLAISRREHQVGSGRGPWSSGYG